MTPNERTTFIVRCLLSGSIGESFYLLGVWFLGSVDVPRSILLSSVAFLVSLPPTFSLDGRIRRLLGSVKSRPGASAMDAAGHNK